ncbi:hypothetical protein [Aquimarina sp. 2201CG5-10]|uniref:hypothetical protein n=1 Tax=Aquimarina callyspongiae TaxID=3098150 RepID=UPI002AB3B34E|nr:hypothetical protein [Aquimarina sp. 2201CG5-10]MDY8135472.1 hypothetical protein [Aquimarina sp. 2201CG5-10]
MGRLCLYYKEKLVGRVDKKFCTSYCKSAYHYKTSRDNEITLFKKIDKQLKKNRKLLKRYNKAGLATVRKEKLIKEGFNPKYFTHYWKNNNSQTYLFCYEYGFLYKREKGKEKYILIHWQEYMK